MLGLVWQHAYVGEAVSFLSLQHARHSPPWQHTAVAIMRAHEPFRANPYCILTSYDNRFLQIANTCIKAAARILHSAASTHVHNATHPACWIEALLKQHSLIAQLLCAGAPGLGPLSQRRDPHRLQRGIPKPAVLLVGVHTSVCCGIDPEEIANALSPEPKRWHRFSLTEAKSCHMYCAQETK